MPTDTPNTRDKTRWVAPVRLHVLLIGAALIPVNLFWMVHVECVRYSDNVATSALFFNAITLLLFLLLANLILRRLWPRAALSRGEILVVYVMVVVSTGLAGHDQMGILIATIHYGVARATPANGWTETVLPNLPRHLVPQAGEAVRDLYVGNSTLYTPSHLLTWLTPIACWAVFILVLVWVMMCISAIFRKQWENERLTYPIAGIPLLLSDPQAGILRNRIFWIAFILAASMRAWVVAASFMPSLPKLSLNVKYYYLGYDMPWVAAGPIPVCFFPFVFGLCFFLPTQIAFSTWFFFILSRLEMVFFAARGIGYGTGCPYVVEQGAGACIGLAVAVIYYARRHLRQVFQRLWKPPEPDEANEAMSYRTALVGCALGSAFLVAFAVSAGMRAVVAVPYLALLMLFVLATARLRAEVGLPTIEFFLMGPDRIMRTVAGDRLLSHGDLTTMSLFFFLSRTSRQFPMSAQVDALQIGRRGAVRLSSVTVAVLLASAVAVFAAFWAFLHVAYQIGYGSGKFNQTIVQAFGATPWAQLHSWISAPADPDAGRFAGYASGTLIAVILSALRSRFIWWPFHPAGYLASCSWGLMRMWVPLTLSWGIKVVVLRYGGLKGYRRAIPFFLGLIAGEFVVGMLSSLLGMIGLILPESSGIGGL